MVGRPLLYLDVDGPLNPYLAKPDRRPKGYETHRMLPQSWIARHRDIPVRRVKPLRVWLNPVHGRMLVDLAEHFDLWWATTWEHDANTHIAPVLGLPELPVVEWRAPGCEGPEGTFWKTAELVEHAEGRPFAWIDDDITTPDRRYINTRHAAPALLRFVHPAAGLVDDDFAALSSWARTIRP